MDKYLDHKNPRLKTWRGKALSMFCVIAIFGGVAGARNASSSDARLDLVEKAVPAHESNESGNNVECDLAFGDTFIGSTWSYTVYSVRVTSLIDEKGNEKSVAGTGPADFFYIVDFGITNMTEESQDFSLSDYKIRANFGTGEGVTISPDREAERALRQPIAEGKLDPHIQNRGEIVFKVPEDAIGVKFVVPGETGATWRLHKLQKKG